MTIIQFVTSKVGFIKQITQNVGVSNLRAQKGVHPEKRAESEMVTGSAISTRYCTMQVDFIFFLFFFFSLNFKQLGFVSVGLTLDTI